MSDLQVVLKLIAMYREAYEKRQDIPGVESYIRGALDALESLEAKIRVVLDPLPDGVIAVGLDNPAELHNTLKDVFGE